MMPLALGSTIGILGDGQLGRMLALSAARLGFRVCIFGPDRASPAGQVCDTHIIADFDDAAALKRLAKACDVITLEWENIPVSSLEILASLGVKIAPRAESLLITQDRLNEKNFARDQGIDTTDFVRVDTKDDLEAAVAQLGLPAVLKTRREGYDGKGQVWIKTATDIAVAFESLGNRPAVLEAKADFDHEISVIAARGYDGTTKVYPIGINHHKNGILDTTIAPAELAPSTIKVAHEIATKVINGLDYVGVLAVELFVMGDGALWLNEIAPRVHNSGHWTQDGCVCDQFEQHIRAITGWPLGDVTAIAQVEMCNLLGEDILDFARLSAEPMSRLHVYGKDAARTGRKMGHINRLKPLLS
jgi:5-(carboxyamino)imidazole ribonucleotide synthase